MKLIASQQEINLLSGAKLKTQDELSDVVISGRIQFGAFEVNLRERELRQARIGALSCNTKAVSNSLQRACSKPHRNL